MFERQALDGVAQAGLLRKGRMLLPMTVVGRPAHLGERAQLFDRGQ